MERQCSEYTKHKEKNYGKKTKSSCLCKSSTQEQANSSYSLEAQRETLREYAEKNNLEIVKEFSDTGSALKSNRQSYQEMLEFLEGSEDCKTILVTKPDRLCRDSETFIGLQKIYAIISADIGVDNILNQLQIMLAQNYSKFQSERIKAGIQKSKEREICSNGN